MAPLLSVAGLRASIGGHAILRGVDFDLAEGEILGLIGESGSGKTMTGLALLRLLPDQVAMGADRLQLKGDDLIRARAREFGLLRGRRLGMVFQDPVGAFNPAKTIGWHFRHVLRRAGCQEWRHAAMALLEEVDIRDPASILHRYPHQLSGGMLQRALIALVVAPEPELVVADEPTTNLDNIVERQIMALFRRLRQRLRAAFVFITHDILLARSLCDRIAVMYAGQIVEIGPVDRVLDAPLHPYTRGLITASAELDGRPPRLAEIAGEPPLASAVGDHCAFEPRCPLARAECRAGDPGMRTVAARAVRCILVPADSR